MQVRHGRFLVGKDAIVAAISPARHFLFLKIHSRTKPWLPCLPWPWAVCKKVEKFCLIWGIFAWFLKKNANFSQHILSLILGLLYLCSLAREQHCESVTRCFTFQVKLWAPTQRHWAIWQEIYPFQWILYFLLQYLHLDQLHSMKDYEISQKTFEYSCHFNKYQTLLVIT